MTRGWGGALPAAPFAFIIAGLAARFGIAPAWTARIWMAGLLLTGAPVVWGTLRGIFLRRFAADLVATLAIVAAVALRDPLPGLIVVLMQTGGEALERYAQGRASDAVRQLEEAAPRLAHRVTPSGAADVPAESIAAGELVLVRPGELVPCDGVVVGGRSHVDTSRLTGEPLPRSAEAGTQLSSGMLNLEGPLTLRVLAPAGESRYARIVDLVRSAQASKAPLQRLADRYAVWFTPFTLAVCALAYVASHDPIRVLAVLVVATPCPLILAAPVAVVGGINRAARRQIIFRHGTALEQLGGVSVGVFDKTGTLTIGRPRVARVIAVPPFTEPELLRLAAPVEHGSSHLLARTLVEAATAGGISLADAHTVVETPGQGIAGEVDGRAVAVGGWAFITKRYPRAEPDLAAVHPDGAGLRAYVAVEGRAAGIVEYADAVRPGLPEFFARLRRLGLRRTLLLSGDSQANAESVARAVGMDAAEGDLLPEDKVARVQALVKAGERVLMVGDGTNDAPALSTATVGIALASGGGGITAEAADAVVLADDPTRIAEAIAISRRTMRIARQSIWVGLGLSGVAMGFAAAGDIPPTAGALLQELIDVAVILNALRTAAPARAAAAAASSRL
ncbi:MAG TPA: heavy metal translocating P-type ATPase [Gemmatimonadales bacterium]|nr:heavy metal translocating P-type ATPase [Gemmatimonadales bacterium]